MNYFGFIWKYFGNKVFEETKPIVSQYILFFYIEFNKYFDIYINVINFKLFLVMSQQGKIIYFYSNKYQALISGTLQRENIPLVGYKV